MRFEKRSLLRPLVVLLLIAAGVWANRNLDLSWTGAIQTTRGWIEPLGAWGPLAFVGVCVAAALVHAPELVVVALGGVLFGKLGGFVYGWVGAVTSSAVCFLLARHLFRDAVRASLTRRFKGLQRLDEKLERHGILTVAVLRLFLFLAPPMNWAIGTTSVAFRHYLIGSMVGLVPGLAITVYFADSITHVDSLESLIQPERVVLAALLLGFALVSTIAVHRLLSRS